MRLFYCLLFSTVFTMSATKATSQSPPQDHPPNPKLVSAYGTESPRQIGNTLHDTAATDTKDNASDAARPSSPSYESSPLQQERKKNLFLRTK